MSKDMKENIDDIVEIIDVEEVDSESIEDGNHEKKSKKKFNIWKMLFIFNMLLTVACVGVSTLLMGKLAMMKLLPKRYFALGVLVLLIIPVCSILLRKKKWATIIFIILNIAVSLVVYKGYTMVDKADQTIDKITEGGDVEVTVMEIRVLSSSNATEDSVLKEYTIGIMKATDRKYADEVIQGLEETLGHKLSIKEYEDDIAVLIKALYDGEVEAIIVNATYGEMLVEIEEYATFTTDTKVLKEVEIEEIIKNRQDQMAEAATKDNEEETTGSSGSSGSGGGGYSYDWYLGQYGDEGGGFVYVEPTNPQEMSKDAFVVYISGIDTYGNVNRKCRSDVNILMAVNTKTKHVLMVNTPRDYYVPLSVSNGVRDKLTHAGNFGVNVSKDTLGMLYGVDAEYYVRMNFTGFIDIINAMGGVDVYSEYAFTTDTGYSYTKGMNYGIDGFKALGFARERKHLAAGDNQRGKNQMAVITAMINKLASSNTLTNYNAIMNAIAGSFQTNFTSDEIYSLIHMQLDDMSLWTIESYSVTGKGKYDKTYSMPSVNAYVMEPNMDTVYKAREMIKKVLTEK